MREALAAGIVRELYITAAARAAHPELAPTQVSVVDVADDVLAAMGETRTPQGLLAVCDLVGARTCSVEAMRRGAVLLDRVGDPGNAGSIIRTADAAGYGQVIFSTGSVDPHNGKVVRASAGSLFHIPIATDVSPEDAMRSARAAGLVVAGTTGAAELTLADFVSGLGGQRVAWWFGSEAHGVDPEVLDACDVQVRIPIIGAAESLNVAAAAAVCLYSVPTPVGQPEGVEP